MSPKLRLFLSAALFAYFCFIVHSSVRTYLAAEVTTVVYSETHDVFRFPSATFCPVFDASFEGHATKNVTSLYDEVLAKKEELILSIRQTFGGVG